MRVAEIARANDKVAAFANLRDHLWDELRGAISVGAERQDDVASQTRQDVKIGVADSPPLLFEYLVTMLPAPFDGAVARTAVNDDKLVVPFAPNGREDDLDPVDLVQGQGNDRNVHFNNPRHPPHHIGTAATHFRRLIAPPMRTPVTLAAATQSPEITERASPGTRTSSICRYHNQCLAFATNPLQFISLSRKLPVTSALLRHEADGLSHDRTVVII